MNTIAANCVVIMREKSARMITREIGMGINAFVSTKSPPEFHIGSNTK